MLVFWVLVGFIVLRVIALVAFALVLVPRGRRCPACGGDTEPVVTARAWTMLGIDRRICVHCGWSWYRKRAPVSAREATRSPSGRR